MLFKLKYLSAAIGLSFASNIALAEEINLTVAAGHADVVQWVKLLDEVFIPEVDKQLAGTDYSVNWTRAYGGTVVKIGGALDAVGEGIVDISYVPTSHVAGKLPLVQVTVSAPFGPDDPAVVVDAINHVQEDMPQFTEMWDRFNVKYLAGGASDSYQIWSKNQITSVEQLDGLKVGSPPSAAIWLKGTGSIPVDGNLSLYYNDVKSGVYDAVIAVPSAAFPIRIHEVAPYISKIDFGSFYSFALIMNSDNWANYPPKVQEAIQAAASKWSSELSALQKSSADIALQKMQEEGATLTDLTGEFRTSLVSSLPNIAREWADGLDAEGMPGSEILSKYMSYVREQGGSFARDWEAN